VDINAVGADARRQRPIGMLDIYTRSHGVFGVGEVAFECLPTRRVSIQKDRLLAERPREGGLTIRMRFNRGKVRRDHRC